MKIQKFNEEKTFSYEEELAMSISDLIFNNTRIEPVPYTSNEDKSYNYQISSESVEYVTKIIINELKEDGLMEFLEYKKYNL